jgi:hypothetical protein
MEYIWIAIIYRSAFAGIPCIPGVAGISRMTDVDQAAYKDSTLSAASGHAPFRNVLIGPSTLSGASIHGA